MKKTDSVGSMFSIRFLGNAFINKTGYYFDTLVRFATYTLDVILIQKKTKKLVGTNLPSLVSFLLLKKPSLYYYKFILTFLYYLKLGRPGRQLISR